MSTSAETPRAPVLDPQPRPTAGSATDRYVLEREIGRGGMGRVFAGRDLRLRREVAVKVLLEPVPGLAARFERESLLAARLQHPGIVPVHDCGFWPTGEPFLVMRLVLGRPLGRAIEEAETMADRLALLPHVVAVTDAIAYAHDQGVIHRDLKPSNVLVGAFGDTVVLDWGLAKDLRADDAAAEAQALPLPAPGGTEGGAVLGTPAYMAPEQAAGERVDARADVYALGAILYHVLAGAPPTPPPGAPASAEPTPLANLEPRTPPDLAAVVGKALARAPSSRYPTAFELGEDLKRFQTAELVGARRYSLGSRALRWARRQPVATVTLVVAGIVALLAWLRR
jgi:serine/threonine protein kinase